jgi:hypothetical protein
VAVAGGVTIIVFTAGGVGALAVASAAAGEMIDDSTSAGAVGAAVAWAAGATMVMLIDGPTAAARAGDAGGLTVRSALPVFEGAVDDAAGGAIVILGSGATVAAVAAAGGAVTVAFLGPSYIET